MEWSDREQWINYNKYPDFETPSKVILLLQPLFHEVTIAVTVSYKRTYNEVLFC